MFVDTAKADPVLPSNWLDETADPLISEGLSMDQAAFLSKTGDKTTRCTNKTFVTRPQRPGQPQLKTTKCWYQTSIGHVVGDYAVGKGESIAGQIVGRPTYSGLYGTSNPNVLLDRRAGTSNDYYKLLFNPVLTKNVNISGSVSYTLSYSDSFTLQSSTGGTSGYGTLNISYSENGRYALFTRNTNVYRVDLETKLVLSGVMSSAWYTGQFMDTDSSITNDGRYLVVTSLNRGWIRVFDLSTCTTSELPYTAGTSSTPGCLYRDVTLPIENSIPSFHKFAYKAVFRGDEHIYFYHRTAASPVVYTHYTLSIDDGLKKNYMALGDSISSGEGAFEYEFPTDEAGSIKNLCHTSRLSYPSLVSNTVSVDAYSTFACSGATTIKITGKDGISSSPEGKPNADNQYYYHSYEGAHYWSPGFDKQFQKVADKKPNILTITVGANDIDFKSKLTQCLASSSTCFNTYQDRKQLALEINGIFDKLVDTYEKLIEGAAINTKLYVIGYPSLVDPSGTACGANVLFDSSERLLMDDITKRLNMVIEAAANRAGAAYIDIENALVGHRLCEGAVNDIAVNGLTAGNDIPLVAGMPHVIGNESYHPNAFGYRKIRDAVLNGTGNFTLAMPAPVTAAIAPAISDTIPLIANVASGSGTIREPKLAGGMTDTTIVYKTDSTLNASVKGFEFATNSGAQYQVEIHSTPISLGTFVSDDNGDIEISATMPSAIEPGLHTLHVFGKDTNNQNMDIYKTIYVAATETDWDGDGIANDASPCLIVPPSNLDEDEDGIDDACDPIIGTIPDEEEEELAYLNSDSTVVAIKLYTKPEEYHTYV